MYDDKEGETESCSIIDDDEAKEHSQMSGTLKW